MNTFAYYFHLFSIISTSNASGMSAGGTLLSLITSDSLLFAV